METTASSLDNLIQYLPYIIPLVILQLILLIVALLDLAKRERTRGPKWLWVILIILGELVGPILYFVIGRED
jgi:drug/metabolite transporter (DMT)-like permease